MSYLKQKQNDFGQFRDLSSKLVPSLSANLLILKALKLDVIINFAQSTSFLAPCYSRKHCTCWDFLDVSLMQHPYRLELSPIDPPKEKKNLHSRG